MIEYLNLVLNIIKESFATGNNLTTCATGDSVEGAFATLFKHVKLCRIRAVYRKGN